MSRLYLYDNIPAILKQRRNWVVWGIRDAPQKSPYSPENLLHGRLSSAKAGVPETKCQGLDYLPKHLKTPAPLCILRLYRITSAGNKTVAEKGIT